MLRRSHPLAAVLAAAMLVQAIPVAHAAPSDAATATDDPEALSDAAVEAFHAKDYDTAIALFERAYELDPQPNYKFNIGRVYEEKGDLEQAVVYYQEFVKSPGVDLESRQAASARLKVLREALEAVEQKEAEQDAQAEPPSPEEPAVTPSDSEPGVDDGVPRRKRQLRIAGYSLLGVGGVALVIGSVFGGLALAKSRDADDAMLVDDKIALRQDAKLRANVADGMLVTGGVLAGVGLVLVLSTLGKRNRGRTAVAPTLGPAGAGLSLSSRF